MTRFVDGSGPVWSGSLFPFLFITIACGAVSGFHALIASGTTPKMLMQETDARFIGYGAMLMESFVAIMALTSASVIDPGLYFGMNSAAGHCRRHRPERGRDDLHLGLRRHARHADGGCERCRREDTAGPRRRSTDACGRHGAYPVQRVGRQGDDGVLVPFRHPVRGTVHPDRRGCRHARRPLHAAGSPRHLRAGAKGRAKLVTNGIATALTVVAWGYFLYQGVVDPLGGINTLWPLFGISNQMLAAVALILATVVLFKMKRERYAWTTMLPACWLLICTLTAGLEKIFHPDPKIGFMSHASIYQSALSDGQLLAPAKTMAEMSRIVTNDYVDTALCVLFVAVVVSMLIFGVRSALAGWRSGRPTAVEDLSTATVQA